MKQRPGSGSVIQWYVSADADLFQNVTGPKHCSPLCLLCAAGGGFSCFRVELILTAAKQTWSSSFSIPLPTFISSEGHCVTKPYKRSVKGWGGWGGPLCALFAWLSYVCLEPTISACSSFPRSRLDNSISWWYVEPVFISLILLRTYFIILKLH
jgi:hypothetical protein